MSVFSPTKIALCGISLNLVRISLNICISNLIQILMIAFGYLRGRLSVISHTHDLNVMDLVCPVDGC